MQTEDVGARAPIGQLDNAHGVPAVLMAGTGVPVEQRAIRQALRLAALRPWLRRCGADIRGLALTPDLHVGAGLPVGVVFDTDRAVVPGALGNDIGCGMRMVVCDVDADELDERELRGAFFEGARDLPLRPAERVAVLEGGLLGLLDAPTVQAGEGLWRLLDGDPGAQAERAHACGSFGAGGIDDAMAAWARRAELRDAHTGSLGGGNHFCELQRVDRVLDGPTGCEWALRSGAVCVMVHAGSLGFGATAAGAAGRAARAARPPGWCLPEALLALPSGGRDERAYLRAMGNAANFAAVNRLALALMAVAAVERAVGRPSGRCGSGWSATRRTT